MQTIIEVQCKKGPSLRRRVADDSKLGSYGFSVTTQAKRGRASGWTKLRSTSPATRGALNLDWSSPELQLTCRVVNRGTGTPARIIGEFLAYLLERHKKQIQAVHITVK